ncbi:MAG TPA: hypothetical protein VH583_21610 [Vicinamibacterales bacterium]|jgi:hypothetical protein
MYWYGTPDSSSDNRSAQPAPSNPEPAPNARSEAEVVDELIEGVRRWQRPDYIGVSRFRGRDDSYWKETRTLVLGYLALKVRQEDFELYRFAFIAWLRASPNVLQVFKNGDDMARAGLVDWFVSRVAGDE